MESAREWMRGKERRDRMKTQRGKTRSSVLFSVPFRVLIPRTTVWSHLDHNHNCKIVSCDDRGPPSGWSGMIGGGGEMMEVGEEVGSGVDGESNPHFIFLQWRLTERFYLAEPYPKTDSRIPNLGCQGSKSN